MASFEVEWETLADQITEITSYELQWDDGTEGLTYTSLLGGDGSLQLATSYQISNS